MANNNTATRSQVWALQGLRVLFQETPALGMVDRQFSMELQRAGTQVNAYRAAKRKTRRKDGPDSNTATDVTTIAVPVVLDQYFFDSFFIDDEDEALSVAQLTRLHALPALQTIAQGVSRSILGRVHAFLRQGTPAKRAGRLGKMTKDNAADFILEAEEVLADNNAPLGGVWAAVVHHTANTKLMRSGTFERMDARGPDGSVMTGRVGKVYNTNVVLSQDVNYVDAASADSEDKAVNNASGYAAGHVTAITTDGGGTAYTVGEYVTIDGNDQPTFATAATATTSVTLNEALKYAVVDDAVIKHYQKCLVNNAAGYAAGYKKVINLDGHASGKNPQVGQIVSFGTGASRHTYTIIEIDASTATTTNVLLDRPLEAALADNADCFPGPAGSMNPVMHREAIAFVSRPMRSKSGRGVIASVANFDGVALRVQEADTTNGTEYVVDLLAGVSVLDEDLLCVMLA